MKNKFIVAAILTFILVPFIGLAQISVPSVPEPTCVEGIPEIPCPKDLPVTPKKQQTTQITEIQKSLSKLFNDLVTSLGKILAGLKDIFK